MRVSLLGGSVYSHLWLVIRYSDWYQENDKSKSCRNIVR